MKKKYKKPEIVFEKLAFKSALATCGYISTKRISEDAFSCEMVYGDDWQGGKGEPTAVGEIPDWVLIGDNGTCTDYFYCYDVPQLMMEEHNKAYIGLS